MPEITSKPTARQIEALRTALTRDNGVISPSFNTRTLDGLVGRDLADWKQPEGLGYSVWGSSKCVITKEGREFLAELDGAEAQQEEAEVIETPAAELLEPYDYRDPQQAGTHASPYFTRTMIRVGVLANGSVSRVHGMECRACGVSGTRRALLAVPCTEEREAEIARLRAITEAPTKEAKRAAVKAVDAFEEGKGMEQQEQAGALDLARFEHMVGTERVERRKVGSGEYVELRYAVKRVKYNAGDRFHRPSVTVEGRCVAHPAGVAGPTYDNSTWFDAYCAEIFYTNPVEGAQGAGSAPVAAVAPVAAPKPVEAPLAPVTDEFPSMAAAVDFLGRLKVGERVRITKDGRTNDYTVSRPARRHGSQGTVNVTVSIRPGGYSFEVSAGNLFAQRGDKATMTLGGTKMMRTPTAPSAPITTQEAPVHDPFNPTPGIDADGRPYAVDDTVESTHRARIGARRGKAAEEGTVTAVVDGRPVVRFTAGTNEGTEEDVRPDLFRITSPAAPAPAETYETRLAASYARRDAVLAVMDAGRGAEYVPAHRLMSRVYGERVEGMRATRAYWVNANNGAEEVARRSTQEQARSYAHSFKLLADVVHGPHACTLVFADGTTEELISYDVVCIVPAA